MFFKFTSFFVLTVLTQLGPCASQLLSATHLNVKLPETDDCFAPFYDGDDSIYLFGGCGTPDSGKRILKFSISSETLERVGTLPSSSILGTVHSDSFGNMFYFGSGPDRRDVFVFNPTTNTTSTVATLPDVFSNRVSFKRNDTSVLIFVGVGQNRTLLEFNMETLISTTVATNLAPTLTVGASITIEKKGFIFSGASVQNRNALELDLDTYEMTQVGPATLPVLTGSSAVWDGKFGYIIGGYSAYTGDLTHGIIQFNPSTYENEFIPVQNFPVDVPNYFVMAPASVFVPSNNRIYCFGGYSKSFINNTWVDVMHDEIFYIDLTPLEPTTTNLPPTTTLNPEFFSCNNRTNGMYPHPSNCSLFIGCRNEEMTIFSCSAPKLFDPILRICNFPEEVDCQTSCIERPDGTYPHPHDCSLYILCRAGSSFLDKCPYPLLFDPVELYCNFPEDVVCSITE